MIEETKPFSFKNDGAKKGAGLGILGFLGMLFAKFKLSESRRLLFFSCESKTVFPCWLSSVTWEEIEVVPRNLPSGPVEARSTWLPFLKPFTVTCSVRVVHLGPEEESPARKYVLEGRRNCNSVIKCS